MSYLDKIKKLFGGKLPKSFSLHLKYGEYLPNETELAAKVFFKILMSDVEEKKKAKELGLI